MKRMYTHPRNDFLDGLALSTRSDVGIAAAFDLPERRKDDTFGLRFGKNSSVSDSVETLGSRRLRFLDFVITVDVRVALFRLGLCLLTGGVSTAEEDFSSSSASDPDDP